MINLAKYACVHLCLENLEFCIVWYGMGLVWYGTIPVTILDVNKIPLTVSPKTSDRRTDSSERAPLVRPQRVLLSFTDLLNCSLSKQVLSIQPATEA